MAKRRQKSAGSRTKRAKSKATDASVKVAEQSIDNDMPPALEDEDLDSDGPEEIPATIPATTEPELEVEREDEDDVEDEYTVEKIIRHDFTEDGTAIYLIKWLGYSKKEDQTWEPVENLENARERLEEYHAKIGGPPVLEVKSKKKGGKRSNSAAFPDSPAAETNGEKRGRKSAGDGTGEESFKLPGGSWENDVIRVSSIVEETDTSVEPKGKQEAALIALLEWKSGRKTQHPMDTLRRKCPQKLLDYYEQHLVFRHSDPKDEDKP